MPKSTKPADQPLERLLELIDEKSRKRHELVLGQNKLTEEILDLAIEASNKGATKIEIAKTVKTTKNGKLESITRQALDQQLAPRTGRREARTTRESRKARKPAAGQVNVAVLS